MILLALFGNENIFVDPHQLRNLRSRALDIISLQLKQGNDFKHKDCALNAILTIIHRDNHT